MMKVKVHPHKTMVNAGVEACVSITPVRARARAYYMGSVMLRDVNFVIHDSGVARARKEQRRNVHAWAVGESIDERTEQYPLSTLTLRKFIQVTYHYNVGRFIAADGTDVTDGQFRAAYFCGRDFYVSKEW
jgi:hypothetical protein